MTYCVKNYEENSDEYFNFFQSMDGGFASPGGFMANTSFDSQSMSQDKQVLANNFARGVGDCSFKIFCLYHFMFFWVAQVL